MPTEAIKIDVSDAASKLAYTISNAIETSTVRIEDMGGNSSVGADRLDSVARAVSDVNDKLITSISSLKTDFDSEMEVLNRKSESTINIEAIQSRIKEEMVKEMSQYRVEINENRSSLESLRSEVISSEQRMDYKFTDVDSKVNMVLNKNSNI